MGKSLSRRIKWGVGCQRNAAQKLSLLFIIFILSWSALGNDLEKTIDNFKIRAYRHWSGDERMSEKQINSLIKTLSNKTSLHLLKNNINYREKFQQGVVIAPIGEHELNLFSKKMESDYAVKVQYNLRYLFEHPYAEASFHREQKAIYLPHASIIDATSKIQSVEHESIHAKVFHDFISKKSMPYYGYFSGEQFKPNDLYLDEMYAYFFDLKAAARELGQYLKNPKIDEINSARLQLIITEREKDSPPRLPPLTKFEKYFDSVVKNVIFGRWHTDPVYNMMRKMKSGFKVNYIFESETVAAKIEIMDIIFTLFLIDSKSTDSGMNVSYLRNYFDEVFARVKLHRSLWSETQTLYHKVSNSKKENRLHMLKELTQRIDSFSLSR